MVNTVDSVQQVLHVQHVTCWLNPTCVAKSNSFAVNSQQQYQLRADRARTARYYLWYIRVLVATTHEQERTRKRPSTTPG